MESEKYYFHCESECLKYNKDYQNLLQTLGLLEAQKIQAIKDLETLEEINKEVQIHPLSVVNEIKKGTLIFPTRQAIATVPDINWEQYQENGLPIFDESAQNYYNTRKKKLSAISTIAQDKEKQITLKDKQNSYGQPWTEEEQIRLEELLRIYPPEDVEAKRWQKIAAALGNRTAKQVCCRVQKYFIKLAKAGLPVPGRMPNLATYTKKSKIKRSSAKRTSLFFHSLKPRVYMTNDNSTVDDSPLSSDDDDDSLNSPSPSESSGPSASITQECCILCSCCQNNLSLIFWKCTECVEDVNLCPHCVNSDWSTGTHMASHEMKEVSQSQEKSVHIDKDYSGFHPSITDTSYNYLDSNFHPAL